MFLCTTHTGRDGQTCLRAHLPLSLSLPHSGAEVQFRPYRTDDFITRLYYETPRFTVLNQTWVLKARVNDSERNPNLSCKRTLSFQLLLKSKVPPRDTSTVELTPSADVTPHWVRRVYKLAPYTLLYTQA